MVDLEGRIDLYLASWRVLKAEGAVVSVLSLEKLPFSRHLTRRPGHVHRVLSVFQRRGELTPTRTCALCACVSMCCSCVAFVRGALADDVLRGRGVWP
jgi:hypothetical protein